MSHQHCLLVIDDEPSVLYSIRKSLAAEGLRIVTAESADRGLKLFFAEKPDVVLLDLRLNDASGLDVLKKIRMADVSVPIVMFTAFTTMDATIEATKNGAFDYLLKPVDLSVLKATIHKAIHSAAKTTDGPDHYESVAFPSDLDLAIIGTSPSMQQVYKLIGRFAPANGNVLITGESGTGKELVAQAVHQHSKRRNEQFLAINCAALSETLLESELFGHEKGAFTGADRRRIGKFEYADKGTIFLDEIADMVPATQAKVLRLLQEQSFERLGGNDTIKSDVRIIAATNKNLAALISKGLFRDDLFYRLNVFCIQLPPLRCRLEDLPDLVHFFLKAFQREFAKDKIQVDPEVMEIFKRHHWQGNLRELQSALKHALAHTTGEIIRPEHLPATILTPFSFLPGNEGGDAPEERTLRAEIRALLDRGETDIYYQATQLIDAEIIPMVLEYTCGNLQQACAILGLSRNTLKAKMRLNRWEITATLRTKPAEFS